MTPDLDRTAPEPTRPDLPEGIFRAIVGNTHSVIWVISRDLKRIHFINREISGISREKVLAEGFSSLWPVMDIESLESMLDALGRVVIDGESVFDIRTRHTRSPDGYEEYYLNSLYPLRDPKGRISHVQINSRDITGLVESKRTIEILNSVSVLMQNYKLREDIFGSVGARLRKEGILMTVLLKVDERSVRMEYTSLSRRKMKKALELMEKERVLTGIPLDVWGGVMTGRREKKAEYWSDPYDFVRSRLRDRVHLKNLKNIVDILQLKRTIVVPLVTGKETIGSLVMISDSFTELDVPLIRSFAVQFSHALMNQGIRRKIDGFQDQLHELLGCLSEGVITLDKNGTILSWNRAAGDILGYSKAEMVGVPAAKIGIYEGLWRPLLGDVPADFEKPSQRVLVKTGRVKQVKCCRVNISVIREENGDASGMLCILKEDPAGEKNLRTRKGK